MALLKFVYCGIIISPHVVFVVSWIGAHNGSIALDVVELFR
jgi:hypothetical protein